MDDDERATDGSRDGAADVLARLLDSTFSGAILLRLRGRRFVAAAGWADVENGVRNGPETRFNTASITKLFTAVAVCRLAERGALALDSSIADLLPHARLALASEIRVEQLLDHTAGFPEEVPDDSAPEPAGGWLALAGDAREFAPGASWGYSNVGYAVLGALIERVTGRKYFEAIDDLVFRPAGMSDSGFDDTASFEPAHAIGYLTRPRRGRRVLDNRSAGLGHGAPYGYGYSTVADLERLIDAIAAGAIVTAAHAGRILRGSVPTTQPGRLSGFGMFRELVGETMVSTTSGAGPGISAWLDVAPDYAYLAVILSNYPKPAAHQVGQALRATFLGR